MEVTIKKYVRVKTWLYLATNSYIGTRRTATWIYSKGRTGHILQQKLYPIIIIQISKKINKTHIPLISRFHTPLKKAHFQYYFHYLRIKRISKKLLVIKD